MKTYSQTYIYRKYPDYEKKMFNFIMKAERINTSAPGFDEIIFDIKRRKVSDALTKILVSDNVILCSFPGNTLPKAFKVFVAKDVRDQKDKYKVFIDVTDIMIMKNGAYTCNRMEWLVSYLINAMTSFIYVMMENRLVGNASVLKDGGQAFTNCFSYIIDRIYKISVSQSLRRRVEYIADIYYQVNILGKDFDKYNDSIRANAIRVSDIEVSDSRVIDIMLDQINFNNLDTFVDGLGTLFKFKDLSVSIILDKWMQAFGTGTVFALEFFPAFSMMLTNTYVGGYIDNQLSIEKVTGSSMVTFSKTILEIGASVV